ncbi:MAG: PSD1 and planctomycete cytochrome C domain-containing protein [Planctomycetia bacterium]|nr:PSD1 and planctomycete cytochrome C domain-containing protein [Planctomycetia bacterium]
MRNFSPQLVARLALLCAWSSAGIGNSSASAAAPVVATKFSAEQIEYFEKQVRPLLAKHCVECHGPKQQEAGLRLDTRKAILTGVEGHPAAVPGDPGRSPIIAATKYDGDVQMPPDGKLPADQLAALTTWVKMGLPWPEEDATALKSGASPIGESVPKGPASTKTMSAKTMWSGSMDDRVRRALSEHWAFQPVRRAALPPAAPKPWNDNPIDRFVAAKLSSAGLSPSPPADKRTLLRRAYFDLIGLPPTMEEIEAFERDASPNAYERTIDRLLASPRYGERWARHWLDVARYGDTKGYTFGAERRFPFSYTYRDYVIRAFNDDLPYDRFIVEQIAADKLPRQDGDAALAAMGFLTCGRQFTAVHDTVDDQIDVVMRGFLGLTVVCARCHDHKFDPLPQEDYYSLYGVFRSSLAPASYPLLGEPKPSPEYEAYKKELAKLTTERDTYVAEHQAKLIDELRTHVSDYLAKIVLDRLDNSSSKEKDFLFDAGDPRPVVIRRWRDLLTATKKKPDPVFDAWNKFDALKETEFAERAPSVVAELLKDRSDKNAAVSNRLVREAFRKQTPKSMLDVAETYGALLESVYGDWKKSQDPKSMKPGEKAPDRLEDHAAEELRQVLFDASSPTTLGMDESRQVFDRKVRGEVDARQRKVEALTVTSPGAPPRAMSLVDSKPAFNPAVFVRGDPARRGSEVPRRNLRLLGGEDRKPFADGSGRLELAQAIASADNPLTARVMVNRIWLQHFGQGLVETPSDFGVRTSPPTHPELLDYLAASFMEEGWSIKRLHRLMMTSQTYRQSSDVPMSVPAASGNPLQVDPENRLLWRMNRRRLELEAMRDSLLQIAGRLDTTEFGRPIEIWNKPYSTRRTIYGYIDRQDLPGIFGVFDFANPDVTIDQRPRTTVPQQALFAMNSPFVQEQTRKLVARAEVAGKKDAAQRIAALFRIALGRLPTAEETSRFVRFIEGSTTIEPPKSHWQYGIGDADLVKGRVIGFAPMAHWTGSAWQPSAAYPDAKFGHAIFRVNSGHTGNNLKQAAVARWTSPQDGVVLFDGELKHKTKEGDGVALHLISSRAGKLGTWRVHNGSTKTGVERVEIRKGDQLDLVLDSLGTVDHDSFEWSPSFTLLGGAKPTTWNYQKEFGGPLPTMMNPWELAAQVLLMSNEFMFVD